MHVCHCGKEFETFRQLNGHKSVHREGGRYSISRGRARTNIPSCLKCEKQCGVKQKFCSNKCQAEYQSAEKIKNWLITGAFDSMGFPAWARRTLIALHGAKCQWCKLEQWNDLPITLECDHSDGNPNNNHIDNLRLLCPNCHSQTDSFKGKNRGNGRTHRYKNKPT